MKKSHLIILFFVGLTFNVNSQNIDSIITKLSGKWAWSYSQGGWGGQTITHDSTGYTMSLKMHQDTVDIGTDSLSYFSYRNDTIQCFGKICIHANDMCSSFGITYTMSDNNLICSLNTPPALGFTVDDTLLSISDCFFDGYYHEYLRDTSMVSTIVNRKQQNHDVVVYPNPTKDGFNLKFNNLQYLNSIDIINLYGQKIISKQLVKINQTNYKIEMMNLECGIYFLIIKYENKIVCTKLIKE